MIVVNAVEKPGATSSTVHRMLRVRGFFANMSDAAN